MMVKRRALFVFYALVTHVSHLLFDSPTCIYSVIKDVPTYRFWVSY